jgi:hypothetical protein
MRKGKRGSSVIGKRPPTERLKVQIYRYKGSKYIEGKALTVYGLDYDEAITIVDRALRDAVERKNNERQMARTA